MENNDTIFSDIQNQETEAGLMQGFFTRAVDIGIELAMLVMMYKFMPEEILYRIYSINTFIPFFIIIALTVIYQLLFLLFFNKTPGMMICRVKYLNKSLLPLSTREKFASLFRTRFSGIRLYKDK